MTWRLGQRWVLAILASLAVIGFAAGQWGSIYYPAATFYLIYTRAWELALGAFLAYYFSNENRASPNKLISEAGGCIGFVLLAFSIFSFDEELRLPSLYALMPTSGTALIILFATQKTVIGRLLSNKLLVGIGLISYSVYLWHQPLFSFARHRSWGCPSELLFSSLAIASIFLAYFSWKYVEVPFRNKQRFSRNNIFAYSSYGDVCPLAEAHASD